MSKNLKYLSIIPLYGTCILLIYLFVLSMREKISKKKFVNAFTICAIAGSICWFVTMAIVLIVSKTLIVFDFSTVGLLITMVIGGYLMNAFTFTYLDKKWCSLSHIEDSEANSSFEINMKKIIQISFILSLVIIIFALVLIFALGLV